ncbi:SDR family oxidoreductase [Streptomyces albofaciens JCM 4342]|uniref:SDR family NAD(P)-dependent oxidoreductase n=1 Tax=Streptomyces albofaciens TaxID=66866 RepID=UPI0012383FBC|nr:SDR family oxidoreductase [Streptomyces albofaciens]KAA6214572.1 SDR family oxidoreductase [Streptomyces albofaciens JCM 4342]
MTTRNGRTARPDRFDADTVALITGGSSGVGLAAARRLLDDGARVVVCGRDERRLDAAAAHLRERAEAAVTGGEPAAAAGATGVPGGGTGVAGVAAGRVLAVRADTASVADLDAVVRAVRDHFGRLDIIFANAGMYAAAPFEEITEADFDRAVGVNFKGVFFTVQRALPLLRDGGAVVINASSLLQRGQADATLHSATKAAAHNLARTLAAALAGRGIRVNSVSPGYVDTPMFAGSDIDPAEAEKLRAQTAAGRFGHPEEIADAVAFLASGEASYINGQDLVVDGGLHGCAL